MEIKIRMLFDVDINETIRSLISESSKFKRELFNVTIQNSTINSIVIKKYLNYINDTLRYWDEFSIELQNKMKYANGNTGVYTISYGIVKDYIYAKYDYASILKFTDKIIKSIESNDIDDANDIVDLFEDYISKAFDDRGKDVATLLDQVLRDSLEPFTGESDEKESKYFDSVKSYNMFNSRTRTEIYNAVSAVISFISGNTIFTNKINPGNVILFVAIINNIVEYVTYTITAYITRIYVINSYAYPYIYKSGNRSQLHESAEIEKHTIDIDSIEIDVMKNMDEMICKDYRNLNIFKNGLLEFISMMGASSYFGFNGDLNIDTTYTSDLSKNIFCNKFLSNPLYIILTKMDVYRLNINHDTNYIDEVKHLIKDSVYNSKQPLQGASSNKQEILHVIKGTKCDDTVNGYKKLAAELVKCSLDLSINIRNIIIALIRLQDESSIIYTDISYMKDIADIIKTLKDLYREFISAFIQKGRDIEIQYNKSSSAKKNEISHNMSIGGFTHSSNINNAIPDTTRMPLELTDLYALPSFESMEMYDEYLKLLPMFENVEYFNEAFNISSGINKLKAFINALFRKFMATITDKQFTTAVEYVKNNESNLRNLEFNNDKKMKVTPYKKDVRISRDIWDNIINGFNNFDPNNIDDIDKFISDLYPTPEIYSWFKSDPKTAQNRFMNYILFNNGDDTKVSMQDIQGKAISDNMQIWITSIIEVDKLSDSMSSINNKVNSAFETFKNKIVSETNKQNNDQKNDSSNQNNSSDAAPDPSNNSNNNMNESGENIFSNFNTIITDAQLVITRIWSPLITYILRYIRDSYKYIQIAYKLAHSTDKNNNPSNEEKEE